MRLLRAIGRGFGRLGARFARRSKWLAQRLWLISLAESSWAAWTHWHRLEPRERGRLVALARKSKGRPSKLSKRERRELDGLLEKLGHAELAGTIASAW